MATMVLSLLVGGMALPRAEAAGSSSRLIAGTVREHPELSRAWWQWAFSLPVNKGSTKPFHPLVDLTGRQCGAGQRGDVMFLGGAFFQTGTPAANEIVRDKCVVPHSKTIFMPLLNTECSTLEGAKFGCSASVRGNRRLVRDVVDKVRRLSAEVDGRKIRISTSNLVDTRRNSPFCFRLPSDNILNLIGEGPFRGGRYCTAVDGGYYIYLRPLSRGRHTIHTHAEIPEFDVVVDVTYHLRVR